jgi:hypothetical protein
MDLPDDTTGGAKTRPDARERLEIGVGNRIMQLAASFSDRNMRRKIRAATCEKSDGSVSTKSFPWTRSRNQDRRRGREMR